MDFLYPSPNDLVVFPDNHDMARFYTQLKGDFDLFKMGMIYFSTVHGVPQFYYGTEVLMNSDKKPDDHGIIRSEFPGGWQGDKVNGFTGKGMSEEQKAAQGFTKKLLNWRLTSNAIHQGKLIQFAPEEGIYCYFRFTEEEKVMVLFNKNQEKKDVAMGKFSELLKGHAKGKDVLSGQDVSLNGPISIPPYTAIILEIE